MHITARQLTTLISEALTPDRMRRMKDDGAFVDLVRKGRSYIADESGCTFEDLLSVMRKINSEMPDEEEEEGY